MVASFEPERALPGATATSTQCYATSNHSPTVTITMELGQPGQMARARGDAFFMSLEICF